MKSIGGYFELECGTNPEYWSDGVYTNSCRNALRQFIRHLDIKDIWVPVYTCDVVHAALENEGCKVRKYNVDADLMPDRTFGKGEYIIYNNYFGVEGKKVEFLSKLYPRLIIDNAQAFYSNQTGVAAVYSPRKFFGLPDGGILRSNEAGMCELERGESYQVCSHLLKRLDIGAENAYVDFIVNDKALEAYRVKGMSNLTKHLMGNIDYERAKRRRIKNFKYLSRHLATDFPMEMADDDVPMVYPLLVKDGEHLKKELISHKIFCATYWPNVLSDSDSNEWETYLVKNLIPIPVDQRYDRNDMQRIIDVIKNTLTE